MGAVPVRRPRQDLDRNRRAGAVRRTGPVPGTTRPDAVFRLGADHALRAAPFFGTAGRTGFRHQGLVSGPRRIHRRDLIAGISGFGPALSGKWQGQQGSNPRPTVLETVALPAELYPYHGVSSKPAHAQAQEGKIPIPAITPRPGTAPRPGLAPRAAAGMTEPADFPNETARP